MSAELEIKMAQMAVRFAARAGEHEAALRAAIAADDREAIASQTHRLAGIAGMFGQPQIGEAAAELEDIFEANGDYLAAAERLSALLRDLQN
ncbi:Hpt domain-containing protein [Qipengyuania huizhouensis]|uniref:Hpt domain-containing protein n=1 Tax=Qipengyuania huizhouensis TaxID=2867245 RepID=UPI001C8812C2|nr:Hpt domain-containing protein [Qipengyuania huizhouensis]MBX7459696.1 Hpt domain-containing protein [Qipengyuania huizhouensis]